MPRGCGQVRGMIASVVGRSIHHSSRLRRMETLFNFVSPPSTCGYLPDQNWEMEYEIVSGLSAAEYMVRMRNGWRRFGFAMFQPVCSRCQQCRSLRVLVDQFKPTRSQKRCRQTNESAVELVVGRPHVTQEKLELYDRYHSFQTDFKGWPGHSPKSPHDYVQSFVDNPFDTEEWCFYIDRKLVGVGYVDALPAGLSAIYFYYDPDERDRSLGTWNVLNVIAEATRRKLPHVYLGYYVTGCRSLEYKAKFVPNQVRLPESGEWVDFLK